MIFFGIFLIVVPAAQIRAWSFRPFFYRSAIGVTMTAGMDVFDRLLCIGYVRRSLCLLALLMTVPAR